MRFSPIVSSLLQTDLYKMSMQAAIVQKYPRAKVAYQFINRGKTPFPDGFALELREQVSAMADLRLQQEEREYLEKTCHYFPPPYFDYLNGYRFNPAEVGITQRGGDLQIEIGEAYWHRAVLWEVTLMGLISDLYFKMTHPEGIAHRRSELQKLNTDKAKQLIMNGAKFTDFGTRRSYSFQNQMDVCHDMQQCYGSKGVFLGTSNPYIAMKLGLPLLGTHAHEWVSGIAALKGYAHANLEMMTAWSDVYEGDLGTALTDTFGTDAFLEDFTTKYAKLFDSVRHDSGDPFVFVDKIVAHYKKLRIDPMSKTIIFSNALTVNSYIELNDYCRGKIQCSAGIGTHFSNDVGVKPLNMVIKLVSIDGRHAIKLSDDPGKEVGDPKTIDMVKFMLNIPQPAAVTA